jgi:hypothetical protein
VPLVQAAFRLLARGYPVPVRFEDLLSSARNAVKRQEPNDGDVLAASLLRGFLNSRSLVALSLAPRRFIPGVPREPRTPAFARLMASRGEEKVTNVRHEQVELNQVTRVLLPLLDGTRDLTALTASIASVIAPNDANALAPIGAILEEELSWLAKTAMFVG